MIRSPIEYFLWVFLAFIIGATLPRVIPRKDPHNLARELMEREAVIAGHAEWRPGTNGEPMFHWRNCP